MYKIIITIIVVSFVCITIFGIEYVYARNLDNRYSASILKEWFDTLKSEQGPCCSDVDGSAVADIDWDIRGDHYWVKIQAQFLDGQWREGGWLEVPDSALVKVPNKYGRAMVWPYFYPQLHIRCFMPGPLT